MHFSIKYFEECCTCRELLDKSRSIPRRTPPVAYLLRSVVRREVTAPWSRSPNAVLSILAGEFVSWVAAASIVMCLWKSVGATWHWLADIYFNERRRGRRPSKSRSSTTSRSSWRRSSAAASMARRRRTGRGCSVATFDIHTRSTSYPCLHQGGHGFVFK